MREGEGGREREREREREASGGKALLRLLLWSQ
jgi:hypothetical protein